MAHPELVRDCATAMQEATPNTPITIKCRIGIDDQDPREILPKFLETVASAGITHFTIHARKAWLQGLSPKENRDVPPLDYPLVLSMKEAFPHLHISINGGITSLSQAQSFLDQGLDGVMIGRSAYQTPWEILGQADRLIWNETPPNKTPLDAVTAMTPYIENALNDGQKLSNITRHMLGVFHGTPGARRWRRYLSENAHKESATSTVLKEALATMRSLDAA